MNLPWIPIALVGFGIVVFVHELGHFLAAKALGVGVEVFSLGWGPKLLGFRRGARSTGCPGCPSGDIAGSRATRAFAVRSSRTSPRCRARRGRSTPCPRGGASSSWLAGPVASLLSAFLIFTLIWWIGFNVYSSDNRIILATDYTLDTFDAVPPATAAGLATGDRITAIDGQPVRNFQEIRQAVAVSAERTLSPAGRARRAHLRGVPGDRPRPLLGRRPHRRVFLDRSRDLLGDRRRGGRAGGPAARRPDRARGLARGAPHDRPFPGARRPSGIPADRLRA